MPSRAKNGRLSTFAQEQHGARRGGGRAGGFVARMSRGKFDEAHSANSISETPGDSCPSEGRTFASEPGDQPGGVSIVESTRSICPYLSNDIYRCIDRGRSMKMDH